MILNETEIKSSNHGSCPVIDIKDTHISLMVMLLPFIHPCFPQASRRPTRRLPMHVMDMYDVPSFVSEFWPLVKRSPII